MYQKVVRKIGTGTMGALGFNAIVAAILAAANMSASKPVFFFGAYAGASVLAFLLAIFPFWDNVEKSRKNIASTPD
ncbi:MAG: hypothetical protein PHE24_01015 [Patescibacteria group bacterium]|nr:hypothetical protein [Patescibacteria group bacterium]